MSHDHKTPRRRELLAGALGAKPDQERHWLIQLHDLEVLAVQVYGLAATSPHISGAGHRLSRHIRGQERAHAHALARAIGRPGADGPAAVPPSIRDIEGALAKHRIEVSFAALRSERAWFTLLEKLESTIAGEYYTALGHLVHRANVILATSILGSEAQHSTLLFSFRHPQDIDLDVAQGVVTGNARMQK